MKKAAASFVLGLLIVFPGWIQAAPAATELPIIPKPASFEARPGTWALTRKTRIFAEAAAKKEAEQLAAALSQRTGWQIPIVDRSPRRGDIHLSLFDCPVVGADRYHLSITSKDVAIRAASEAGLFYGGISLQQMLNPPAGKSPTWTAPCAEIEDIPRFAWRGLLVDPARHFLPVEFLKKFMDTMAFYKLNRLQLHLSDDQGWRVEIKKDPRLTVIGSIRRQSPKRGDRTQGDGRVYGPFYYTQEQIRDLAAYARGRHITLVPEIEIPGHFGAAIAAHPEFSCRGKSEGLGTWGINADIMCPGNDAAVEFVKGVLEEICGLFPSEYIHIGGDEVPRERWKTCAKCQARMKTEGLQNEAQLQTWLNHQLEQFLASKGRRMIGWDEILEGGLTPGAIVMSWRGSQGGIDAAKAGHDVIMSPTTHCYFDYAQAKGPAEPECIGGFIPLEMVYSFNPQPPALSSDQQRYILGVQGNLWGEYMWEGKDVEYFAFPRALALAEVGWSAVEGRTLEGFLHRLSGQFGHLERMNVNYRRPRAASP